MRLTVRHTTRYKYETPLANAMQQLRLTPPACNGQTVLDWAIDAPGIERATTYTDAFGNLVHMVSNRRMSEDVEVTATGTVETEDLSGVLGKEKTAAPSRVFSRVTPLTEANQAIVKLGTLLDEGDRIANCHALMHAIRDKVGYRIGVTETHASAISALNTGEGVCQDHAHIFIAALRSKGLPARYVSGYLLLEADQESEAHHAWAETYVDGLGWLGFDVSNGICPTDHYIRLTTGLDSRSAAPIKGIQFGGHAENMNVEVDVSWAGDQQQQQ